MEIVIDCDVEYGGDGLDAQLRFLFGEVFPSSINMPWVDLGITLTINDDWTVELGAYYYLAHLALFADELERLHQTMEGIALLDDWDNNPVITFKPSSGGHGMIAITGKHPRYLQLLNEGDGEPICDAEGAVVVIAFQGLRVHRNDLPPIIAQFRQALQEIAARESHS